MSRRMIKLLMMCVLAIGAAAAGFPPGAGAAPAYPGNSPELADALANPAVDIIHLDSSFIYEIDPLNVERDLVLNGNGATLRLRNAGTVWLTNHDPAGLSFTLRQAVIDGQNQPLAKIADCSYGDTTLQEVTLRQFGDGIQADSCGIYVDGGNVTLDRVVFDSTNRLTDAVWICSETSPPEVSIWGCSFLARLEGTGVAGEVQTAVYQYGGNIVLENSRFADYGEASEGSRGSAFMMDQGTAAVAGNQFERCFYGMSLWEGAQVNGITVQGLPVNSDEEINTILSSNQFSACDVNAAAFGAHQPEPFWLRLQLLVEILDDDICMEAPDYKGIDPGNSSWVLRLQNRVLTLSEISPDNYSVNGLPEGLNLTAAVDTDEGTLVFTASGTAANSVNQEQTVELILKGREGQADSEAVSLFLKPSGPQIVGSPAGNSSITMLDPGNILVDPADDNWGISISQATLRSDIGDEHVRITGLPVGLNASVTLGTENTIVITVAGQAGSPIDNEVNVQVVVLGSAAVEPDARDSQPITVTILPGTAKLLRTEPGGENIWFVPEEIFPRVIREINSSTRYALRLTFSDPGATITWNDNIVDRLRDCRLTPVGGTQTSLIDTEVLDYMSTLGEAELNSFISQYIFIRDQHCVYLYIPMILLQPQNTYQAYVAPDLVRYGPATGNPEVAWRFATMAVPVVRSVSVGSLHEDYDSQAYIMVRGDGFNPQGVEVFFNDTPARRVHVRSDREGAYLKVYLPQGSRRLEPGLYSIKVVNSDHSEQLLPQCLSIVPAARLPIPEMKRWVREDNRYGEVVASPAVSEDTLELDPRYSSRRELILDLDELLGTEALVRQIKLDRRTFINRLEAISSQGNVTLYGVQTHNRDAGDSLLYIGRTPPHLAAAIQKSLPGGSRPSSFFEIGGQNVSFDQLVVRLPFESAPGTALQVMRYDREQRKWLEQSFQVDLVNNWVYFTSTRPGIFTVISL